MVLGGLLGLFDYTTRLLPVLSNVFVTSVTISPVIVMLSEQYSSSWGGFMIRSAIGFAILNFAIFPLYVKLGSLNFHNWNFFYHYLVLYGYSLIVRLAFLWIEGIKKRHLSMKDQKAWCPKVSKGSVATSPPVADMEVVKEACKKEQCQR